MHKIRFKLAFTMVVVALVSMMIVGGYAIYDTVESHKEEIAIYRATLYEQFDRSVKLQVETAVSLVQDIYNQQQKGMLSEVDAKKRAADLVRNLRFDNGNYFWFDNTAGNNVDQMGRDQEGKTR